MTTISGDSNVMHMNDISKTETVICKKTAEIENGNDSANESGVDKRQSEDSAVCVTGVETEDTGVATETDNKEIKEVVKELPVGWIEDRFRVDRKRLEALIATHVEGKEDVTQAEQFFDDVMAESTTQITWPSKLKVGAKSRKDPHIKICGLPENVTKARKTIMDKLDSKSNRVTLKIEVAHTDHSHIIGKGGSNIKHVMASTDCHIHFPDSNRNNTTQDKSNQVSIAGEPLGIETARNKIRQLLPVTMFFEYPTKDLHKIGLNSPSIMHILQMYSMTIQLKTRRSFNTLIQVRCTRSNAETLQQGFQYLLQLFNAHIPTPIHVSTAIEIQNVQSFLTPKNVSMLKRVQAKNGITIQLPPHIQQPMVPMQNSIYQNITPLIERKIVLTGTCEGILRSREEIQSYLPIVLMFDIKEDIRPGFAQEIGDRFDCYVCIKMKPKQTIRSCIVKGSERQIVDLFKARQELLNLAAHGLETLPVDFVSKARHTDLRNFQNLVKNTFSNASMPPKGSAAYQKSTSPMLHSLAPGAHRARNDSNDSSRSSTCSNSRIGTQVGMHHSKSSEHNSDCGSSSSHSDEESMRQEKIISECFHRPASSNARPPPGFDSFSRMKTPTPKGPFGPDNGFYNSCKNLSKRLQAATPGPVIKPVLPGQPRVPTSAWSGFGFSDSTPASMLKDQLHEANMQSRRSSEHARNTRNLKSMSLTDLFTNLGLSKYTDQFQQQEIDVETFLTMTDKDLNELGVNTFGARRKMTVAIKELNEKPEKFLQNLDVFQVHQQKQMIRPMSTSNASSKSSFDQPHRSTTQLTLQVTKTL